MNDEAPEHHNGLGAAELVKLGELAMTSERDEAVHAVTLFGELDLATVDEVRDELEHADASDAAAIVLDLSGLTFMDSTGVQRVLEITGVADVLPFAD